MVTHTWILASDQRAQGAWGQHLLFSEPDPHLPNLPCGDETVPCARMGTWEWAQHEHWVTPLWVPNLPSLGLGCSPAGTRQTLIPGVCQCWAKPSELLIFP